MPVTTLLLLAGVLAAVCPAAAVDLSSAKRTRLKNGLTLLVLEDHTFPVVSVQMLYRVGARNEVTGLTGLAHFLEHMAFRATESFPDTEVVSAIYGAGGEWHGYTWLDQTTYFETAPVEELDLLLRIEADRMHRLLIPEAEIEAERGAVLAELHGYENDPASVLHDAVLAASFLQHHYRNNTIGWESDVEKIEHSDLVDFYLRHYQPGNAVLAVVGAVAAETVEKRVRELFGILTGSPPTPPPRTVEPAQLGERRLVLHGAGNCSHFKIAYRGPSVNCPDWPAFLVLQELLGGGDGVNFSQNEWGTPVRSGAILDGVTGDLTTWFPPQAEPYVLTVGGTVTADAVPEEIEAAVERRTLPLRQALVTNQELDAARERVLTELIFDVETTEDAAHQLAYFEGLGALDVLLALPDALTNVGPEEIRRVAGTFLQPWQRTIGWYLAGSPLPAPAAGTAIAPSASPAVSPATGLSAPGGHLEIPRLVHLDNGLPVIMQRVGFAPTVALRVLLPGNSFTLPGDAGVDAPIWRHTSLDFRARLGNLHRLLRDARVALDGVAMPAAGHDLNDRSGDPQARLQAAFRELIGVGPATGKAAPVVIVLVGDIDTEAARSAVNEHFGDVGPAPPVEPAVLRLTRSRLSVTFAAAKAQARLGYVVTAPPPGDPGHLAWRVLLYILTHGYEGRLGKEAITRQGLIYYIDSNVHSDGRSAWISLDMGVDPHKLSPLRDLLVHELAGLKSRPPTSAEVEEAKKHLIGRRISAAQSPAEISSALLREWMGVSRLRSLQEYSEQVSAVSREDVQRIVPAFSAGAIAAIEVGD
jgi:zinc protease